MRRWARLRTADPPEPEGEPDPQAVQAGGPVGAEGPEEEPAKTAEHLRELRRGPRRGPAVDPARAAPAGPARAVGAGPRRRLGAAHPRRRRGGRARPDPRSSGCSSGGSPAAWPSSSSTSAGSPSSPGSPCSWPARSPARSRTSSTTCPTSSRHANQQLDNFQTFLNNHGINVHIKQQGSSALDTLQKDVLKRSGDIVSFSRDLLSEIVTIGFDLVLILVLSIYLLVYGHQIGELVAPDHAVRRRHARGRLSAARPARGLGLRARPAPVQPGHGRQRRHLPGDPGSHRDLPGGQGLRGLLRGVLRADGVHPLHRARSSARSRRSSSPCSRTRSAPSG